MSVKFYSIGSLIAAAALSCGPAQAEPLFALFNAPTQTQIAPQYAPTEQSDEDAPLDPRLQRQIVATPATKRPAPSSSIPRTPSSITCSATARRSATASASAAQGFTWAGVKQIARKAEWPDWIPPQEMIARQPYLPRFVAGGPGNPLGARAMYLGGTRISHPRHQRSDHHRQARLERLHPPHQCRRGAISTIACRSAPRSSCCRRARRRRPRSMRLPRQARAHPGTSAARPAFISHRFLPTSPDLARRSRRVIFLTGRIVQLT